MKEIVIWLTLIPGLLIAAPKVASEKVLNVETDANGNVVSREVRVKYAEGWSQLITYKYKKGHRGKIVGTYDKARRLAGFDVHLHKEDPPLTVGHAQQLLSDLFKKLTLIDYNPNEFILGESELGKPISVWKKKYRGEIIYTYVGSHVVGCGTGGLIEAVEKGIIPK